MFKTFINGFEKKGRYDSWCEKSLKLLHDYLVDNDLDDKDIIGIDSAWAKYDDLETLCDDIGIPTWEWLDEDAEAMGLDFDDFYDIFLQEVKVDNILLIGKGFFVIHI